MKTPTPQSLPGRLTAGHHHFFQAVEFFPTLRKFCPRFVRRGKACVVVKTRTHGYYTQTLRQTFVRVKQEEVTALSSGQGLTWEPRGFNELQNTVNTHKLSPISRHDAALMYNPHSYRPRYLISKSFTWGRMKNVSQPLFTALTRAEGADRGVNRSSV